MAARQRSSLILSARQTWRANWQWPQCQRFLLSRGVTGAATPVLYGVASIEEIERRLYRLFVRTPGEPLFDLGGGRPPANPLFQ